MLNLAILEETIYDSTLNPHIFAMNKKRQENLGKTL
jgi:hypothetical protein